MTAENDRHQKLNTQLEGEVKNLTGQVTKFTAENDRYQKLNNQLEGQVKDLTGQVTKFTAENDRYTKLNNQLNGEVNNLKEQNAKLDQTRKALEAGVDDLKKQVNKFFLKKTPDLKKQEMILIKKLLNLVIKLKSYRVKLLIFKKHEKCLTNKLNDKKLKIINSKMNLRISILLKRA